MGVQIQPTVVLTHFKVNTVPIEKLEEALITSSLLLDGKRKYLQKRRVHRRKRQLSRNTEMRVEESGGGGGGGGKRG